jgi:hypothetical protein
VLLTKYEVDQIKGDVGRGQCGTYWRDGEENGIELFGGKTEGRLRGNRVRYENIVRTSLKEMS